MSNLLAQSKGNHQPPREKIVRSTAKHHSPPYADFFNQQVLSGTQPQNLVAVKGDGEGAYDIIKKLGVPLVEGGFKERFYARGGLFDQIVGGRGAAILELGLPAEVDKVMFLKIGRANTSVVHDTLGYNGAPIRALAREIQVTILSGKSGTILKTARIQPKGVGYSDDALQESYLEALQTELQQFQSFFDY